MKKMIIAGCIVVGIITAAENRTVWTKFQVFAGTYFGVDVHKFVDGSNTCYVAVGNSSNSGNNVAISCVKY